MALFDLLNLCVLILCGILGYNNGLSREIISLMISIIGIISANIFAPPITELTSHYIQAPLLNTLITNFSIAGFVIGFMRIFLMPNRKNSKLKFISEELESFGGSAFGAIKGSAFMFLLFLSTITSGTLEKTPEIKKSLSYIVFNCIEQNWSKTESPATTTLQQTSLPEKNSLKKEILQHQTNAIPQSTEYIIREALIDSIKKYLAKNPESNYKTTALEIMNEQELINLVKQLKLQSQNQETTNNYKNKISEERQNKTHKNSTNSNHNPEEKHKQRNIESIMENL